MNNRYLQAILMMILLAVATNLSAQTKDEKYTHSISLSEKRIIDGKNEFKTKGQFPVDWKLYFKTKEGDFAVFYDWNGHEMHFRFRRNKFDEDGDYFARDLIAGNPYQVKGEWIGYYYYPQDSRGKRKATYEFKKLPANANEFTDPNSVPVFKLLGYTEMISEQILY